MIQLTRLNNTTFTLNADLIKFVEQNPDTVITLLNGEKLLVRENVDEVVRQVIDFRRELLSATVSWSGVRAAALPFTETAECKREKEG